MAGFDWFRMYTEARTDKKLALLDDSQHRVWFNLLCMAAEQRERRGTVPAMSRKILAIEVANQDTGLLNVTIELLIDLEILTEDQDGALTFRAFEARQHDKPSDMPAATAQRKRDQRERERQSRAVSPSLNEVTPVTPTSRDVTRRHATDKNRREEIRESPAVAIAPAGVAAGAAPPPAEPAAVIAGAPETAAPRAVPKPKEREKSWIEQHPLFPAIVATAGRPAGNQWGECGQHLRTLDELGATEADLLLRWENYPAVMGSGADGKPIVRTLRAVLRNWHLLESVPAATARASPNGNGHRPGKLTTLDIIEQAFGGDYGTAQHPASPGPSGDDLAVARARPARPPGAHATLRRGAG